MKNLQPRRKEFEAFLSARHVEYVSGREQSWEQMRERGNIARNREATIRSYLAERREDPRARVMTQIANTENRYGSVAITLHWLLAVLLIALVALGLFMVRLPDVGFDTTKIRLILYHKDLGVLALALATLRLAWRVTNALPRLVANLPDWQKIAARFVHLSFYGLMFALPITGWLMSSAAGFPVSFVGLFYLPDLLAPDDYLFRIFIVVHKWLGYALIALIVVHAAAALRHHFLYGDDTLRKMLPIRSKPVAVSPFLNGRTRRSPSELLQ